MVSDKPGAFQVIVSMVKHKTGQGDLICCESKTDDMVSNAIIDRHKPLANKVRALNNDNGK